MLVSTYFNSNPKTKYYYRVVKMEEVYIKTEQIEIEVKLENSEDGEHQNIFQPDSDLKAISNNCVLLKSEFENDRKPITNVTKIEVNTEYPTYITQETSDELEVNGKVYENGKINRLTCSRCGKSFKNRANLKNHLKYVHSEQHSVECSLCFRTFKSHAHLRSHLDSVHAETDEVSCHICDKVFLNQKKLKNHIFYTHPQPEEQVACTVCSKVYKSQYNLKVHMRQVHPEGQSVSCPHCDKTFKVDMLLQRHIKWSHPNDGMVYKCHQCFKVLPSLACYKKHIENTHDESARAKCLLCTRIFKTKKSLDRHLINVHTRKEVKTYVPSKFVCSYCERSFESNTTLFWHTQKYHLEGVSVCDADSSNTNCEICVKSYSDNASLQRHLASVHSLETASCNICMKEFKSAINLQSHIRITHAPPEATQICDVCNKTFKCALHLRMHVSAVHTDGEFNCDICDKSFTSLKYLSKHKKTHIQTREHPCELCGKMFKSIFAANKHRRNVHGGVKCCFCHIKQAKLEQHLLKCPKRDPEVGCCVKCGSKFEDNAELHQHILSCGFDVNPIVKIEEV